MCKCSAATALISSLTKAVQVCKCSLVQPDDYQDSHSPSLSLIKGSHHQATAALGCCSCRLRLAA